MEEFSFSTRIFFGDGALDRLRMVNNKKVIIVTDSFMVKSGTVDRVISYLSDCSVTIFSEVIPDPTVEVVAAGVKSLLESQAEVMIAIGGGSAIDAAKAIRALAKQINPGIEEVKECYAIPTTSGTGSEVTEYAVISDAETGIKYPLVSRDLRPFIAILDPSLVLSAPPNVTADSGMDVLTHALEAYVSKGANDFTDALAEKAIELAARFLPLAYKDGQNLLARKKMHNASCMAGLAFNSAGLGLCHGLAHSVGAKLHISHGRANAIILPHIIRYNANQEGGGDFSPARKYQNLAKLLDLPSSNPITAVNQLVRLIERLNVILGLPATLKAANVDSTLFASLKDEIAEAALNDITTASNPRTPSIDDAKNLLRNFSGY